MQIDPCFVGSFSQEESAKMRRIYKLAVGCWPTGGAIPDDTKYKLASAIIYICTSEKEGGAFLVAKDLDLANEAVEVLLQLPDEVKRPQFEGSVGKGVQGRSDV